MHFYILFSAKSNMELSLQALKIEIKPILESKKIWNETLYIYDGSEVRDWIPTNLQTYLQQLNQDQN